MDNQLGGISSVFPIGSFVRIVKKGLSTDTLLWTKDMDETLHKVGLVITGSHMNNPWVTVAVFSGKGVVEWWYNNDWLESINQCDVEEENYTRLQKYLQSKIITEVTENINGNKCPIGGIGEYVQVTDEFYPIRLRGYAGVVCGYDAKTEATIVFFPEPICCTHQINALSLKKIVIYEAQSFEMRSKLCSIRDIVIFVAAKNKLRPLMLHEKYVSYLANDELEKELVENDELEIELVKNDELEIELVKNDELEIELIKINNEITTLAEKVNCIDLRLKQK